MFNVCNTNLGHKIISVKFLLICVHDELILVVVQATKLFLCLALYRKCRRDHFWGGVESFTDRL